MEELLSGTSVLAGSPVKTGQGAVKTGQAPRWSCWPGQVLAGAGAGRGAAAERHLEGAGRGAAAKRHLEDDGRGAVAKSHLEDDGRGAVAKRLAGAPWRRAIGKQLRAEVPIRQHREETAGQADVEEQGRQCRIAKAASATSGRQVFPRRLPANGRQASCAQIAAGGD